MALRIRRRPPPAAELSMSSMIDMVFLLLIFFLATARPMKSEADLGMKLPGTVESSVPIEIPDPQRIELRADGSILLNDSPVGTRKDLRSLRTILTRYRESCVANQSAPLLTLSVEDAVPHQWLVDMLELCHQVGIQGISFASDGAEE